jgi:hypothetical protein
MQTAWIFNFFLRTERQYAGKREEDTNKERTGSGGAGRMGFVGFLVGKDFFWVLTLEMSWRRGGRDVRGGGPVEFPARLVSSHAHSRPALFAVVGALPECILAFALASNLALLSSLFATTAAGRPPGPILIIKYANSN